MKLVRIRLREQFDAVKKSAVAQVGNLRYSLPLFCTVACGPRYNLHLRRKHRSRRKVRKVFLLILDSVGNSELLVILAAALIFFGPRRLPQLSRQIGKSLSEFRRASEDFKRTWEREVNLDDPDRGTAPVGDSFLDKAADRIRAAREAVLDSNPPEPAASVITPSVTAVDPSLVQPREAKPLAETAPADHPDSNHDWL